MFDKLFSVWKVSNPTPRYVYICTAAGGLICVRVNFSHWSQSSDTVCEISIVHLNEWTADLLLNSDQCSVDAVGNKLLRHGGAVVRCRPVTELQTKWNKWNRFMLLCLIFFLVVPWWGYGMAMTILGRAVAYPSHTLAPPLFVSYSVSLLALIGKWMDS